MPTSAAAALRGHPGRRREGEGRGADQGPDPRRDAERSRIATNISRSRPTRNSPCPEANWSRPCARCSRATSSLTGAQLVSPMPHETPHRPPRHHLPLLRPGDVRPAPADAAPARQSRPAAGRAELALSPPGNVRWMHDVFGNSVALVDFRSRRRARIVSTLTIERYGLAGPNSRSRRKPSFIRSSIRRRPHRSRPAAGAALSRPRRRRRRVGQRLHHRAAERTLNLLSA